MCNGCVHAMKESGAKDRCAYCRTPYPRSDEKEEIERVKKLMDAGNTLANFQLAGLYAQGIRYGMRITTWVIGYSIFHWEGSGS